MSATNALKDVKSYMDFWGWTDGGSPGWVKKDYDGHVIARHGDAQWIRDIDEACATLRRLHDRILGQPTYDSEMEREHGPDLIRER